ncbi:MAG: hypothetical protein WC850_06535 [Candidatus Gracilibacteria bacterium]
MENNNKGIDVNDVKTNVLPTQPMSGEYISKKIVEIKTKEKDDNDKEGNPDEILSKLEEAPTQPNVPTTTSEVPTSPPLETTNSPTSAPINEF